MGGEKILFEGEVMGWLVASHTLNHMSTSFRRRLQGNYGEALANPYPELPDPLTLKIGRKITTPEMWWKLRRQEIAEDYQREFYGRMPANTPSVK